MTAPAIVEIKADEVFEHLPHAPIVEAVIEIRARPTQTLEESSLRSVLEARLNGYGFLDSLRGFHGEVKLEGGKPPTQKVSELGWMGVRFRSADGKHIAQFKRDGFEFSRLEPYIDWDQLSGEALRLWSIFKDLGQPREIYRIGVRFINRIQLPPGEVLFEDYIQPAPMPPRGLDLPFQGYVHHDTLAVPGHPYAINVIQTIQPPLSAGASGVALILDLDVFATQPFTLDDSILGRRLLEMRWLKNKAFFGSITQKALEMFK